MRKNILIPLCVLVCVSLFGCSTESVTPNGEGSGSANIVVETETAAETTETETETETTEAETETTTETTVAATTTKPATTTTTTTTTTEAIVKCTVEIECKDILSHMDGLKKGHEAYVPKNGVILSAYSVTVKKDETVYDALIKACDDNGIKVNQKGTDYGKYIAGFNEIDEKDCGATSGWLYYVNGEMPMKACNKYVLSEGDKIVFHYTTGK